MKTTVCRYTFEQAFKQADRFEQFGYDGLSIMFDYVAEYEASTGLEVELDVIAICCEYTHDIFSDIADSYSIDLKDCEDDDDKMKVVREYLEENTQLCGETSNSFVYLQF